LGALALQVWLLLGRSTYTSSHRAFPFFCQFQFSFALISGLALYPFFVLTLDSGLRPSETRAPRRRDLNLIWCDGVIAKGEVIVGRFEDGGWDRPGSSVHAAGRRSADALAGPLR